METWFLVDAVFFQQNSQKILACMAKWELIHISRQTFSVSITSEVNATCVKKHLASAVSSRLAQFTKNSISALSQKKTRFGCYLQITAPYLVYTVRFYCSLSPLDRCYHLLVWISRAKMLLDLKLDIFLELHGEVGAYSYLAADFFHVHYLGSKRNMRQETLGKCCFKPSCAGY